LLMAVDAVNNRQKLVIARKIEAYFAEQGGVAGKTLALWGLAFKANTDDMREAPSLELINYLTERGMRIQAFDPVAADNARRILADNPLVTIFDDQYAPLQGAAALAVVTEWNQFRNPGLARIKKELQAPVVFDGRNLYSPQLMAAEGFAYFCVGR
jgi:UDPglucose 6-dehydrogenase